MKSLRLHIIFIIALIASLTLGAGAVGYTRAQHVAELPQRLEPVDSLKPTIDSPTLTVDSIRALSDSIRAVLPDSISVLTDSLMAVNDSLEALPVDSIAPANRVTPATAPKPSKIRRQKVDLDATVNISSADSMVMIGRNNIYLYGNSKVDYGELKLAAAQVELNLDRNEVYAVGAPDSVGEIQGKPVFEQGGTSYESSEMTYNFKTQRGLITNVVTEQGEGYITGGTTKKTEDGYYYIENGRYTTCDDHEHPHFWLQMTRAKVKPGSNAVTGPAYMVLAGLPLPLAVPFGYFPFTDKYAS
ncbi:MAG: hypothetical protein K2G64_02310, partial [Muribaculaceae bacterium]|nr:hypothetical protein [Muribaculaceae bacterium]